MHRLLRALFNIYIYYIIPIYYPIYILYIIYIGMENSINDLLSAPETESLYHHK